jgi:hypothetical protein
MLQGACYRRDVELQLTGPEAAKRVVGEALGRTPPA